jgi:hypothetical protein
MRVECRLVIADDGLPSVAAPDPARLGHAVASRPAFIIGLAASVAAVEEAVPVPDPSREDLGPVGFVDPDGQSRPGGDDLPLGRRKEPAAAHRFQKAEHGMRRAQLGGADQPQSFGLCVGADRKGFDAVAAFADLQIGLERRIGKLGQRADDDAPRSVAGLNGKGRAGDPGAGTRPVPARRLASIPLRRRRQRSASGRCLNRPAPVPQAGGELGGPGRRAGRQQQEQTGDDAEGL